MPYLLFLLVNGFQLYLAKTYQYNMPAPLSLRLSHFQESPRTWLFWLAREGKDWLAAGLVGSLGITWLVQVNPLSPFWLAGLMYSALLVQGGLALGLVLTGLGFSVPHWLQQLAVRASLPQLQTGSRWRALCWGGLFLAVGFVGLWSWFGPGKAEPWVITFLCLVLGFLSLLRAAAGNIN